jgi:hypothetical protein
LNNETQNLSDVDSIEFKNGWEDGFVEGVRILMNKMVNKEDILVKNLNEIDFD